MKSSKSIFSPGESARNAALGGKGGLMVESFTNGITGGGNGVGRTFKVQQGSAKFTTSGYPK